MSGLVERFQAATEEFRASEQVESATLRAHALLAEALGTRHAPTLVEVREAVITGLSVLEVEKGTPMAHCGAFYIIRTPGPDGTDNFQVAVVASEINGFQRAMERMVREAKR